MRTACLVLLAVAAAPALGQDAPPAPSAAVADEIIVRGRTGPRIRVEIERLEDSIYKRFNDLNSNDEFDIFCTMETPTGSHMPVRACLPQFAITAEARAAYDIVRGMQPTSAGYASIPGLHLMRMNQKGDELVAEMQRVAREDEELLRQLARLAELKERFGDRVGKRR